MVSRQGKTATFDDWKVDKVKRPKASRDCSEFSVSYTSKKAKAYEFKAGDSITIQVTPVAESPEEHIDFRFTAVASKKLFVIDDISFDRAK